MSEEKEEYLKSGIIGIMIGGIVALVLLFPLSFCYEYDMFTVFLICMATFVIIVVIVEIVFSDVSIW